MLVIPSDVSDAVGHMEALKRARPLPQLMERELLAPLADESLAKHYVLLHDGYAGGDDAWRK